MPQERTSDPRYECTTSAGEQKAAGSGGGSGSGGKRREAAGSGGKRREAMGSDGKRRGIHGQCSALEGERGAGSALTHAQPALDMAQQSGSDIEDVRQRMRQSLGGERKPMKRRLKGWESRRGRHRCRAAQGGTRWTQGEQLTPQTVVQEVELGRHTERRQPERGGSQSGQRRKSPHCDGERFVNGFPWPGCLRHLAVGGLNAEPCSDLKTIETER
ncbi:hypothetical protein DFH06DRAFT_1139511 [Mycena polygramma]|nr:hypothetical protein DFH06DRAFT_1139511 [Mycena polygramma]